MLARHGLIAVVGLTILLGCRPERLSEAPLPTIAPTIVPSTATEMSPPKAAVTVAATVTHGSEINATRTPTLTATPSTLTLAIPATWRSALAQAENEQTVGNLRVVVREDAMEAIGTGEVDLALAPGHIAVSTKTPQLRRPISLAVPFSTDWDGVTLSEAMLIVEGGHPLVMVVPWSELPSGHRSLFVEGYHPADADYPLQETWHLVARAGIEMRTSELARSLSWVASHEYVHVSAVGDVMLDRMLGDAIRQGDTEFPFALLGELLQEADFTVGNLECALGDIGTPAAKAYVFRAPPGAAQSLAGAGFDLVTLANNHALDYGREALIEGIVLLNNVGIASVGAGPDINAARAPHVASANGMKLAFLGYVDVPIEGKPPYFDTSSWAATEKLAGLAWAVPDQIAADTLAALEFADHVVVLLHSGYEYQTAPSPNQMAAARAAIDAGAALVIGHHAHVLQGVAFDNGGVIAYGLGNFAFTIDGPPETTILDVWFDADGVHEVNFTPAIVQGSGQPRLANDAESAAIRRYIYGMSQTLNSGRQ